MRSVLLSGSIAVFLACLFPAWKFTLDASNEGAHLHTETPAGFRFFAVPPESRNNASSVNVDIPRTILAVAAALSGAVAVALLVRKADIP